MRQAGRRFHIADDNGAAIVEFTLALPFLMLLAAGLSEFGLMLHQQQILSKSVRDGARFVSRAYVATASCPISTQPEWAQTVADAKNIVLRGNLSSSAPLLIAGFNSPSMVAVADGCVPAGSFISPAGIGNNIPFITITATAPYAGTGFLGFLGLSNVSLTATHQEMWVGL